MPQAETASNPRTLHKDIGNWLNRNLAAFVPLVEQTYGQAVAMTAPAGMGPSAPMPSRSYGGAGGAGAGGAAMAADDDDDDADGPVDPSCVCAVFVVLLVGGGVLVFVDWCGSADGRRRRKEASFCKT